MPSRIGTSDGGTHVPYPGKDLVPADAGAARHSAERGTHRSRLRAVLGGLIPRVTVKPVSTSYGSAATQVSATLFGVVHVEVTKCPIAQVTAPRPRPNTSYLMSGVQGRLTIGDPAGHRPVIQGQRETVRAITYDSGYRPNAFPGDGADAGATGEATVREASRTDVAIGRVHIGTHSSDSPIGRRVFVAPAHTPPRKPLKALPRGQQAD